MAEAIDRLNQAAAREARLKERAQIWLVLALAQFSNGEGMPARASISSALDDDATLEVDREQITPEFVALFYQIKGALHGRLRIDTANHMERMSTSIDGAQEVLLPFDQRLSIGRHMVEVRDGSGELRYRRELVIRPHRTTRLWVPISLAVTPRSSPREALRRRWGAGVGGYGSMGASPGLSGGVTLQLRHRWSQRMSAAFEGRLELPRSKDLPLGRVRVARELGSVMVCGHHLQFYACGLLASGVWWASGEDLRDQGSAFRLALASGARLGVELRVWRGLSLQPFAELLGSITRLRIVDRSGAELWHAPAITGAFGVMFMWER